jgi:hypothetical protein
MFLQIAAEDIGQLTDIEPPPRNWPVPRCRDQIYLNSRAAI